MASTYYDVLTEAINDFLEHGFTSRGQLELWMRRLTTSADALLTPPAQMARMLSDALTVSFNRSIKPGKLQKLHPGISAYTLDQIKPKLRAELDRRILASTNLIQLNREASIAKMLQRFSGWATSIPTGGTDVRSRKEDKAKIRKGLASLPFEERRVLIDQGFKLNAAVNDIVSRDAGAIFATWRHVREGGGYQARPEHEARNGRVFLIRDSWAHKAGLVKSVARFTDEIEQPAELPYCRCTYEYGYALRDLPPKFLTAKGTKALEAAREAIAG